MTCHDLKLMSRLFPSSRSENSWKLMIRYYFKWLWFLCRANEETISRVNKYGLLEEQHCDPEEIAVRTARHWYPRNMKPARDAYLVLSCRQTPGRLGQLWKSAQGQDYFKDPVTPVTKTARWSARCSDMMLWCWKNHLSHPMSPCERLGKLLAFCGQRGAKRHHWWMSSFDTTHVSINV
jgi:hypothetical protein